jgi:hypothetical protein
MSPIRSRSKFDRVPRKSTLTLTSSGKSSGDVTCRESPPPTPLYDGSVASATEPRFAISAAYTPGALLLDPAMRWPDDGGRIRGRLVEAVLLVEVAGDLDAVAVVVLDAGRHMLIAGPGSNTSTYTASLVKILVVAQVLARDDGQGCSFPEHAFEHGPAVAETTEADPASARRLRQGVA